MRAPTRRQKFKKSCHPERSEGPFILLQLRQYRRHAAIDHQGMAGDVGAGVRGQQQQGAAQVLGLPQRWAAVRCSSMALKSLFCCSGQVEIGADIAGRDGVHGDVGAELGGQRSWSGRRCRAWPRHSPPPRRGRGSPMIEAMLTMRPYLRASMWRPTSRASMNWRDEVGLDRGAEIFGRGVDDRLAVDDAGIVDQHVDAAVLGDDAARPARAPLPHR